MYPLLVFFGFPGSGKTTLIKSYRKGQPIPCVDVFTFVKKYKNTDGYISPKQKIKAHEEAFAEIAKITNSPAILELGTSNPEYCIKNIKQLNKKFSPHLFFCIIDKDTAIKRVLNRDAKDSFRNYSQNKNSDSSLSKKFNRPFPDEHINEAQKFLISYTLLDMNLPSVSLIQKIKKVSGQKS